MKTETGYLTRVANPRMSGQATIVFRSSRKVTPKTKYTVLYCDAGFGVRQLVAALGVDGQLTGASGQRKVRYTIDGLWRLASVEPL